ncbi:MAG TPA: hypothetical protein VD927_04990 [Chryseosolibacter sp.]|nr:hypothetical protein [Chryseosolibacter sp.]
MSDIYNLSQLENRLISAYAVIDDYCDDFLLRRSEVASFISASDKLLKKFSTHQVDQPSIDDPNVIRKVLRDQLYSYLTQIDLMKTQTAEQYEELVHELSAFLSMMSNSRQLM